ncbi:hypothetical protein GCM10010259_19310 [Streptomyces daghestanicus]|nr:hypothetical protein GCM10010259_19310 [Streptomyces daghestanicus]
MGWRDVLAEQANKKGRRRRFVAVRQYRSGRWTASYLGPDGERIRAEETFERAPDAGAVNFGTYAEKWVEQRELAVRTEDLYRHLLRLHILPTFGTLDLDEITAPRVREWHAERLRTTAAKTTVAKSYRLLKGIVETAVDDDLISRSPCRIKGAGKELAAERRIATVAQVDNISPGAPRRGRTVWSSSGRRGRPSGAPRSGESGDGRARSSVSPTASASTISGTPGTRSRHAPGPPSRTRWSASASRPRRPRWSPSTPTRSGSAT